MDKWLTNAKKRKLNNESCENISDDDTEINKEKSNFLSNEPNDKTVFPKYCSEMQWKEKLKIFEWLTILQTLLRLFCLFLSVKMASIWSVIYT